MQPLLLRHQPPQRRAGFWLSWLGFCVLGTVNNLTYVIVGSAAKSIAEHYCAVNLIGAVTWANVAFGFLAKGLNAACLLGTSYTGRIWGMVVGMTLGLLLLAYASSFGMALAGIVLCGAASSFGEGVVLGYLGLFDKMLINAWSSGTGMAGVGGSALYLGYLGLGLSFRATFLWTIPWLGLYLLAFHCLVPPPVATNTATGWTQQQMVTVESHCERFSRCMRYCGWVTTNLCLVYVFEYIISAGMAAKVLPQRIGCTYDDRAECEAEGGGSGSMLISDEDGISGCYWANATAANLQCPGQHVVGACEASGFAQRHVYAILGFCYQAGVLLSRSSLQVIQIDRVELLTVAQAVNLVLWTLQVYYKIVSSLWLLFGSMVSVGLLGGASYVNVFHVLLKNPNIPEIDREYTIQLAAVFGPTLGITLASLSILLIDNTFLANA